MLGLEFLSYPLGLQGLRVRNQNRPINHAFHVDDRKFLMTLAWVNGTSLRILDFLYEFKAFLILGFSVYLVSC